jgi:NADPH-dependent 2,4-dienoyl-CoA reductase/sulfur reductase-like enzyme
MGKKERLVVIGGTAAGLSAASKAKRLNPDLEITVFEKTGYISYGACGLPYFVGGMIGEPEQLVSVSVSEMEEKRNITVLIHHEVTVIRRQEKEVTVKNLETGTLSVYGYDYLVIATGAVPVIPELDGVESKGVCVLRTVEDGIYMKYLASNAHRACIAGGGFIGLELSEQLASAGLQVTVFEAMDRLLPFLPEAFSHMIQETLESHGIKVLTGSPVTRIESEAGHVKGVCGPDGIPVPCGLVVLSIGVRPATALAQAAGLELGLKGGIVVDEHQRTSDPAIFACGDCVQMKHILSGKNVYVPLGTTANKMGRVAGSVIGGEYASFPGVLGSMVTKVYDCCIAATGLSLSDAKAAGFHAAETLISKSDRASYYPGGRANFINLVFDTENGRLLGAQGIGSDPVAGRINVLVACITAGMTVAQVNDLDLVYAPPVAPVYDPVLIAASQALKQVVR